MAALAPGRRDILTPSLCRRKEVASSHASVSLCAHSRKTVGQTQRSFRVQATRQPLFIPPDTTVDGKVLCSGNDQGGKGFPRPTPGASTYSIGAVETKAVETKKVISAHASVRECHLSKQGFALKGRLARTAAGTGSGALRLLMRLPKNR